MNYYYCNDKEAIKHEVTCTIRRIDESKRTNIDARDYCNCYELEAYRERRNRASITATPTYPQLDRILNPRNNGGYKVMTLHVLKV
jgi:hypothetical protein